jgi:2-polyprenyl-6-methoxyphenol hydroxylase-like FAD-dependent oxidoreductase
LLPQLLEAANADPDLYFDSASQIHLPSWHRGRVVLVGDAAHAASGLSGRGTSLALTGTWFLTEELERAGSDLELAFVRRGLTEQAADAAVDHACRMLRLPTIRAEFPDMVEAAAREQMIYRGLAHTNSVE